MYYFLGIFLILALFFILFFHYKKRKILKKLACMPERAKCELLEEICAPLGYTYTCREQIFSTRSDAWQKTFGYTYAYDRFAPFFNMVFDAQPVYFVYAGHTWLFEFWKGQYGIVTGAEIGLYRADGVISTAQRKTEVFQAIPDALIPETSFILRKGPHILAEYSGRHWWPTVFLVGRFTPPAELSMDIQIAFPNCEMLSAFVHALLDLGYTSRDLTANGHQLSFTFANASGRCICPYRCGFLCRLNRRWALSRDRLLCRLYSHLVKPVSGVTDQLLYLYYYLPSLFRKTFRLYAGGRYYRKQHRQIFRRAKQRIRGANAGRL